MSIRTNDFRQFHGKTFKVEKVYNDYRTGCIDKGEGQNPRYVFRTFKWFPKVEEEVLVNGLRADGSKLTKEMETTLWRELREQVWEGKVPMFYKVKEKLDSTFYKTWGKVFDLELSFEQPIEVTMYKKKDGTIVTDAGTLVNLTGVSAGKVKSMIRSLVDQEVPMVDGKDKAGNPAKVEAYDFEDTMKASLEGLFVKVKVSGEGLDTKYIFNEGKAFEKKEEPSNELSFDDIPF